MANIENISFEINFIEAKLYLEKTLEEIGKYAIKCENAKTRYILALVAMNIKDQIKSINNLNG